MQIIPLLITAATVYEYMHIYWCCYITVECCNSCITKRCLNSKTNALYIDLVSQLLYFYVFFHVLNN
jgi:hypothetical protein